MLLDAEGYVRLADFGFASFAGSSLLETLIGTPIYVAPELL